MNLIRFKHVLIAYYSETSMFLERRHMDRGENRISVTLPIEAILPLDRWKVDRGIGSRSQACCMLIIEKLYEDGYLSDEDFESIRERTKIFRTDREYLQELRSMRKVEAESEFDKRIKEELKKINDPLIKKTVQVVMYAEPSVWWEFKENYEDRLIDALGESHPLTQIVLKRIRELESCFMKEKVI